MVIPLLRLLRRCLCLLRLLSSKPPPAPHKASTGARRAKDAYGMLQGPESSQIAHSAHLGGALLRGRVGGAEETVVASSAQPRGGVWVCKAGGETQAYEIGKNGNVDDCMELNLAGTCDPPGICCSGSCLFRGETAQNC